MSENEKEKEDQDDGYLGNMWGWKTSMFGLILILSMLALMGMRKCYLDKHPEERVEINES